MANYTITYACGHGASKQLFGKEIERRQYIDWAKRSGRCEDCRAAEKTAELEATEAKHDLPPLAGSDKQISWARVIRAQKLADVAAMITTKRPATMTDGKAIEFDRQTAVLMQAMRDKTRAGWWIDQRDLPAQTLAMTVYRDAVQ